MKLNQKKTTILALTLILLGVSLAFAVIVWRGVTHITVKEPFTVTTTIPQTLTLAPGDTVGYKILVQNEGNVNYTAILTYSVEADGCTVIVTPPSGTEQPVPAGGSTTFLVTITVYGEGTAAITWEIERAD